MIRFYLTIIKIRSLYDCNMKKDFKNIIELVEYFYLDEFSFRYNSRDKSDIDRFKMFCHNLNGKLLYNDLIA